MRSASRSKVDGAQEHAGPTGVQSLNWPADHVERRPLKSLTPYVSNPRLHSPAQVGQIAAAMKEWGWTTPVLVDEEGVIICGHGRVMAAEKLGLAEVPVMVARGWTDAQKRAYVIWDNQSTLNGSWDEQLLRAELGELQKLDFELSLTGFDDVRLATFIGGNPGEGDPEEAPAPQERPISRTGDLWVLGKHRLLCGDSTKSDDIIRLMAGERASLFSTDPPYAVGYVGGSHPESDTNRGSAKRDKNWGAVYHEADNEDDGEKFYGKFVKIAVEHAIEPNAAWYCWHPSIRAPMVERVWNANGAFAHQQIIWVKSRSVLTYSVYMWQHEPCLMGWVRTKKPRTLTRGNEFNSTVWTVPNSEVESHDHPTSKPTRLFRVPMEVHTLPNEVCYEPFSGSGSQMIAAEMLGRRCFALEISPTFVDVAVRRWQKFTGQKAILEGTTRSFDYVEKERAEPVPA